MTIEGVTVPTAVMGMEDQNKSTEIAHIDSRDEKTEAAAAPSKGVDIGAQWLATYTGPRDELTSEASEAVRNRIDKFLMPICFYIYFSQQLDKSSGSFAAIFGFSTDAHLVGTEYSWLSSIVYFAQLVCQPLSVYALVKFPVNYWIIFCFGGWGASCMILAAFKSFPGLLVFRFILGGFEASISPSMLIVVSMWWTRREQPLRNNIWYSANGMALILGSLLAFGLSHIENTSLYTYQWIFLINGLIAVLLMIPTAFILPAHPTKARFLTDEQKYIALERIRLNNTGTHNTEFKWSQVRECFLDLKSWGWVIMIFCVSLVSGGISSFGPLILKGFGLDSFQTILYNMIPGAIGIVANILSALAVTYTKRKMPVLLVLSLFPLAGACALYTLPRGTEYKHKLLAVYFIMQAYQALTPIMFSWAFANTAGHTKKTTTTGMLFIGLTTGNIVGPQLYLTKESPYYKTGLTGNLVALCVMFGVVVLQAINLKYLNLRNARRRRAAGKSGAHVDYSLEASTDWAKIRSKHLETLQAEGGENGEGKAATEQAYNAHAFDDLTDHQNEDFIYSL